MSSTIAPQVARINIVSLRRMMLIPLLLGVFMVTFSVAVGESALSTGFLALSVVSALLWRLLPSSSASGNYSKGEILATAALAWAMIGLLGSLPFWVNAIFVDSGNPIAVFQDPVSSIFESFSGFTTSGLTMVAQESKLPASLQLWRSLTQWLGGIGLALLLTSVIQPEADDRGLSTAEYSLPKGAQQFKTVRTIWVIYTGLTLLGISGFWLLDMGLWNSINHAMTAVSTGGFTVTDDSFAGFSIWIQLTAMLLTLSGAISFGIYRDVISTRRVQAFMCNSPVRALCFISLTATVILWSAQQKFETDFGALVVPFQVISAVTTAGFSTVSLGDWHSAPLAILCLCMLIGGAAGSTAGGIKIDRVLLLSRGIGWQVQRLFDGADKHSHVVHGEQYASGQARLAVEQAATLIVLWISMTIVGSVCLSLVVGNDYTFTHVVFEVISAQSGVGLTAGITSAELPTLGKGILVFLMWAGRLELLAMAALFYLPLARWKNRPPLDRI